LTGQIEMALFLVYSEVRLFLSISVNVQKMFSKDISSLEIWHFTKYKSSIF